MADLFRHSVDSRLAGYADVNDAARMAVDTAFRSIGSEKIWECGVTLTSTLHWVETELRTGEANLPGLAALNQELVGRVNGMGSPRWVVLDMDSSESPVHGMQGQSAYIRTLRGHLLSSAVSVQP